jgi:hypothetical protein
MDDVQDKSPAWANYGLDQAVAEGWCRRTFNDKVVDHLGERGSRITEEAIETHQVLAQMAGLDPTKVRAQMHHIVDDKMDKPPGELKQEIGGLMNTILVACAVLGFRLDEITQAEIARVLAMDPEVMRRKQREEAALGTSIPIE